MTGLATLTSKNQLTLPGELVTSLSLRSGARFWVRRDEDGIVLKKVGSLREVQGILASHPLAKKSSSVEIVKLARKKKIARLWNNAG